MDDEAALIARRVALAADAWLAEPRDTQAYQRLVAAVAQWRAYRQPALDSDELLDELGAAAPPQPIGELLTGDPREVAARLRDAL